MSPATAFWKEWTETPINQCNLWQLSWVSGGRNQSINVTCDSLLEGMEGDTYQPMSPVTAFLRVWKEASINQCHLWLPSSGYGRRQQSINVTCDCPSLRDRKEKPVNQCHLWLPSWQYGRRHQSINVTRDCLLEGKEGDTNQSMPPVTAFLRVWKETPINQCHLWQPSWGCGRRNQSINAACNWQTPINQYHLWLPSWGYGRKRLSAWPPGILRGRGQCRQAGGWRGTQTLTQKEHNNDMNCRWTNIL